MKHPTKSLRLPEAHYFGSNKPVYVDIDEMLVPLIREMWRAGIETAECCQEPDFKQPRSKYNRRAFIYFEDVKHLQKLLKKIVAFGPLEDDDLSCRLGAGLESDPECGCWEVELYPSLCDKTLYMHVVLYFPQRDIQEAAKRLRAYNTEAKNKAQSDLATKREA